MEKVILIKGNVKRPFSPIAAKIAVEHLGWSEFVPVGKPSEVLTKTKPPKILKPVPLVEAEYPGKQPEDPEAKGTAENVGNDLAEKVEVIEEVKPATDNLSDVKKTHKSRVSSKSSK